jgi:hypothetical protein
MRMWVAMIVLACACRSNPSNLHRDASVDADIDAYDASWCRGDYGALGPLTGSATAHISQTVSIGVPLDPGPNYDALHVVLTPGKGAFTGDLSPVPGTYAIAGDETSPLSCGVCIGLSAHRSYFAIAGSFTFTIVMNGPVQASAHDLEFVEIDSNSTPIPGGCTASITSVSFSAAFTP